MSSKKAAASLQQPMVSIQFAPFLMSDTKVRFYREDKQLDDKKY